MNKKILLLIMTLLLVAGLAGCENDKQADEEEATTIAGQHYLLYFLNNNEFYTAGYYTETTDTGALVNELLGEMGLMGDVAAGELRVEKTNVSNGTAYIYFNDVYENMANVYEVLFRASIVKTLSQLQEVNYVYFYIENMALTYDNGQIVGLMSETDFIADSDSDLTNLAWDKVTLYFADESGQGLVERQVDVAYIKTVSKERLVVEQLIQGPNDDSCIATINPQVKLLGVAVNAGTCYVNLDPSFVEQKVGVPFELTLYSIVNSLCELETVNKVQFQVNGDSHVEVNGFSFENNYTRNHDLIYREVIQ